MKRMNTNDYEKYFERRVIPAQAGIHPVPETSRRDVSTVSLTHGFTHGKERDDRPRPVPHGVRLAE